MVDIGSLQALLLFDDIDAERRANRKETPTAKLGSKTKQKTATISKCTKCANHQDHDSEPLQATKYKGYLSYGQKVPKEQKSLYSPSEKSSSSDGNNIRYSVNNKGTKKPLVNVSESSSRSSGIWSRSGITSTEYPDGQCLPSSQTSSKAVKNCITNVQHNDLQHQRSKTQKQNDFLQTFRSVHIPHTLESQKGFGCSLQPLPEEKSHSRKISDHSAISAINNSVSSQSDLQKSNPAYYTLQPRHGRNHSRVSYPSVCDKHWSICNTFWRAGLVFSSYTTGDKLLEFGSLWPKSATLESLTWEAYYNTSLKKSVLELCRLGICCGPFKVLEAMLIHNIIGVNTRFENGGSLLHLSCIAKNYEAVTYICEHGGDKNITDRQGRTPAEVCDSVKILKVMGPTSQGHQQEATETSLERVAAQNASVSTKGSPTLYEKQLMFEMATVPTDVDELLLKLETYDFDVNEEFDENGDFLIHLATTEGISQLPLLIPLVRMLNADVDLTNRTNHTSLMLAAKSGDHVMLDVMMCVLGANPNLQQPETGYTALHLCCLEDHAECVRVLLTRGADFNIEDTEKMRPDDLALKVRGHESDSCTLIQKCRSERMAKLTELIQQDQLTKEHLRTTDMFVTDPDSGFTLIMMAAYLNKTKSLRTLLNWEDAPINAQHGKTMQTALSFAAEEGNVEAMQVLLEKQANPAILDLDRLIPIHYAVRNNHVQFVNKMLEQTQCLLGLELALHLATSDQMRFVIKSAMIRRQRDLVTPALFECAMSGDAERLYCVLEEGDCVSPVSGFGQWPLYLAVENKLLPVVRLLCECGADLYRKHKSSGNTVLHHSAALGLYDITEYLLKVCSKSWGPERTDVNRILHVMNYDGKTPLMLAGEKGWMNVVELLLSRGSSSSVLNFRGELYTCQEYQGCQSLIENHRAAHTKTIMDLIRKRDGLKKLQQVFLPRFDHNVRDENGDTPLMVACQRQNLALITFLLRSAVYVVEHQKNFQGSFARSFQSSRSVSDSGRHSPAENCCYSNSSSIDPTCCHETSRIEAEIHNTDDGFLEKCCLKQSCEDLCKSNGLVLPESQSKNNVLHSSAFSRLLPSEKVLAHVEPAETNKSDNIAMCKEGNKDRKCSCGGNSNKVDILLGSDMGCQCKRCRHKRRTSCEVCQKTSHPNKKQQEQEDGSSKNVQGLPLHTIVTETGYIPEDKEYEEQIQENISALFTSIYSVNNRGSIYITEIMISHLCAKNLVNGVTCFHRLILAGDSMQILTLLLDKDRTGINLQDNAGLTPIHLAAQLGRKKMVTKMTSLSYIDLNVRTLDGRLPEEMTKDTTIQQLLKKSRDQEPQRSVLSPLFSSLSTSVFGAGSLTRTESNSLNFDKTHQEYMDLRQNLHYDTNLMDKSNGLIMGMI